LVSADNAAAKALFLRTYSRHVTLLRLDDKICSEQNSRALSEAGVHLPKAPVQALCRNGKQIIASMRDGTQQICDVIYPVLGCDVRSELGKRLGVRHNDAGCLEVDAHQQTSLPGLYAHRRCSIGSASDCGRNGHAAVAAAHLHNDLPLKLALLLDHCLSWVKDASHAGFTDEPLRHPERNFEPAIAAR
jgi:thioredoxin reductase (NADPH)